MSTHAVEIDPGSWFTGLTSVFSGSGVGRVREDLTVRQWLPFPRKPEQVIYNSIHTIQPGDWVVLYRHRETGATTGTPLPSLK